MNSIVAFTILFSLVLAACKKESSQSEARLAQPVQRNMWLPETTANTETLEVLAENGIRFTLLAPRQAKRVRRKDGRKWIDVSGNSIDPSRAYLAQLPSRKSISVFFYDGPISQAVAFEGLLDNGQRFADRLSSGFSDARTWPQMVHIATDGESYGHHHHYGEMALSFALRHIDSKKLAELTNYGQFLERFPANHTVEIVDDSSWSCVHGAFLFQNGKAVEHFTFEETGGALRSDHDQQLGAGALKNYFSRNTGFLPGFGALGSSPG